MDIILRGRPTLVVAVLFTFVLCSHGLECYSCLSTTDPYSCNQTTCGQNEVCFTDRKGAALTLGCATHQQCTHGSTLIGRDLTNLPPSDCHECCSTDLCNTHLCAHSDPSACVDDETVDCPKLNTLFNICAEVHQAKLVCAKFCDLCSLVDGQWSLWSPWSVCSVTCEHGIAARHRTCTNPAPANGGLSCFGPLTETKMCSQKPCPVDGHWSLWSAWSVCSVSCENGTETRHRACTNPAPTNGGLSCFGALMETKPCSLESCPVHGGWSTWADWGSCSVSCDVGMQYRERSCNNPAPAKSGDHCFGNPKEYSICMPRPCANGGWSVWEAWSSCSDSCGGGVKTRERRCNNPPPSLIGRACTGTSVQSTTCNRHQCPDTRIYFTATTISSGSHSDLIFSHVLENYGNGYNSTTGNFTCTVSGLYYFSASLSKSRSNTDWVFCYLKINSKQVLGSDESSRTTDDEYSLTISGTFHLNKTDYVNIGDCEGQKALHTSSWCSFTGFLISAD